MSLENLDFGLPTKRQRKTERFPNESKFIMHQAPEEGSRTYKMELTKTAVERLNMPENDAEIGIAVDANNRRIFLANLSGKNHPEALRFTKQNTFSNRKYYELVAEWLGLDTSNENVLNLDTPADLNDDENVVIFELVNETKEDNVSEENTTVEDSHSSDVEDVEDEIEEVEVIDEDDFMVENNQY